MRSELKCLGVLWSSARKGKSANGVDNLEIGIPAWSNRRMGRLSRNIFSKFALRRRVVLLFLVVARGDREAFGIGRIGLNR